MSTVVLDELDTQRLLRLLYNGVCPERVHILICACGKTADLHKSPKAWNGWQVLPFAKCPDCMQVPCQDEADPFLNLPRASTRFHEILDELVPLKEGKE